MIETGLLTVYPSFNLGAQWEPAQPKPTDQPWIVYATIDNGPHATARLIQPWTDELSEVERYL